jgi:AcrR family transcriptional regulator
MAPTPDAYLEERKAEILQAARVVFIRHGFERATMQDIATEVGISPGAIYRYFPSKESLITSACAAAAAGYLSAFDGEIDDRGGLELLLGGGRAVWDVLFGPEGDDALRINLEATVAGVRDPEIIGAHLRDQMASEVDQLSQLVERAQGEGTLAADFDPRVLGAMLLAATQGMHVLNAQLQNDTDIEAAWRLLTRMVEGLEAPAAAIE